MPPKKIKLLEKATKSVKVDSDDVDNQEDVDKKKSTSTTKSTSIISKSIKEIPEPIIKDEEVKVEEVKVEELIEDWVKVSAPIINKKKIGKKIVKNSESIKPKLLKDESINKSELEAEPEAEPENKIKQQIPKSKKNTIIKQSESAFDMFGDDKDDYREILINYDYTKNKTLPKITKYERALLIGKRAKQIEDGANPNIKVMPGQSSIDIAEEELRQRKIPLIIKRPNGNTFEYWKPADMEVFMD